MSAAAESLHGAGRASCVVEGGMGKSRWTERLRGAGSVTALLRSRNRPWPTSSAGRRDVAVQDIFRQALPVGK